MESLGRLGTTEDSMDTTKLQLFSGTDPDEVVELEVSRQMAEIISFVRSLDDVEFDYTEPTDQEASDYVHRGMLIQRYFDALPKGENHGETSKLVMRLADRHHHTGILHNRLGVCLEEAVDMMRRIYTGMTRKEII